MHQNGIAIKLLLPINAHLLPRHHLEHLSLANVERPIKTNYLEEKLGIQSEFHLHKFQFFNVINSLPNWI